MSFSLTQFGRSGHRDDRRRRLLAEEQAARGGTAAATAASPTSRVADPPVRKTEHYGDALFLDRAAHAVGFGAAAADRLSPWSSLALSLLIAGLEALYAWMPSLAAALGHADFRPADRDIRRPGPRRQGKPGRVVLVAACCWPPAWSRCWSTRSAATGWTTIPAVTASGFGPPYAGSWRPRTPRPACTKAFET